MFFEDHYPLCVGDLSLDSLMSLEQIQERQLDHFLQLIT